METIPPIELRGILKLSIGGSLRIPRIRVADRFRLRVIGLMGRPRVPESYGAGLLFGNCRSLHACFMRFDLEVWFLDAEGQPMGAPRRLKPWRIVLGPPGSRHCMEITPGILDPQESGPWIWENA